MCCQLISALFQDDMHKNTNDTQKAKAKKNSSVLFPLDLECQYWYPLLSMLAIAIDNLSNNDVPSTGVTAIHYVTMY